MSTNSTIKMISKGSTTIEAKNNNNVLQDIILDGNLTVNGISNLKNTVTFGTNNATADILAGKDDSGNIGSTTAQWNAIYVNNLGGSNNYVTNGYVNNLIVGSSNGGGLFANTNESNNIGVPNNRFLTLYVKNIGDSNSRIDNAYITTLLGTNIGGDNNRIANIYGTNGNFTNLTVNGTSIDNNKIASVVNGSPSTTTVFWRGDGSWSNTLTGNLTVNGTITGGTVKGAVFNDYAEYRTTINLEAGRVVVDQDDGTLKCSDNRLLPGAQVISDTFGFSIGEMKEAKTPLAIAGRVLVYPYQNRENYHAGMAVCSAPNGTVDIMTREEIKEYPDCIIGIVSEIPKYKEWGTNKIKVNNRIWIKVK